MSVLPWRSRCSNQNVNINILVEEKQLAFSSPDSDGQGLSYSSRHPLGFICGFSVLWNFGNDAASPGLRSTYSLWWSSSFPILPSLHTHLMPFFIHVSLSCLHSGYFHSTRTIPGSSSNTTNSLFFLPLIFPDPPPMWIMPRIPFLLPFPTLCIHALNYLLFVPASPGLWLDLCVCF